jgi:hypothetical protein
MKNKNRKKEPQVSVPKNLLDLLVSVIVPSSLQICKGASKKIQKREREREIVSANLLNHQKQ